MYSKHTYVLVLFIICTTDCFLNTCSFYDTDIIIIQFVLKVELI